MKARLIIVSSVENRSIANAVQDDVRGHAEIESLTLDFLRLSSSSISSLTLVLEGIDIGVIILGPDDLASLRHEEFQVARDRVMYQVGLFAGKLGRDRCFVLAPGSADDDNRSINIPGLNICYIDPNKLKSDMKAAIGSVGNEIRLAVLSLRQERRLGGKPILERAKLVLDFVSDYLQDTGIRKFFYRLDHGDFQFSLPNFPGSDDEIMMDRLLYSFDRLGYLLRTGVVTLEDVRLIEWEAERVMMNPEVEKYLQWFEADVAGLSLRRKPFADAIFLRSRLFEDREETTEAIELAE